MATVFKTLLPNTDIKSTRTLLHEAIPITGSIMSGTYGNFPNGENIKNYAHGMFQSVYDYPYLSSSANHIFDITVGCSNDSALAPLITVQHDKKINMYNQMAALLMGYDATGSIIRFDRDGDLSVGTKIDDAVFINFARLLQKDEIKKGSFQMTVGGAIPFGPLPSPMTPTTLVTFGDTGAQNDYRVNAAAGEYGILTCSAGGGNVGLGPEEKVGLIFYQAGVVVISSSLFQESVSAGGPPAVGVLADNAIMLVDGVTTLAGALTGTAISGCADALRHRVQNIQFNNTTELNSTIHFCRLNSSDYNYSSNPSYLTQSQLIVKNSMSDAPVSYVTTVGLYGADNELLAVAKLSEPLKKDPTNEMVIRVRLDY